MKKTTAADSKKPIKLPGGAISQLQRTSKLTPYTRNPRKNDHAVSPVAKSIEEFGFRSPIEVDGDGEIVAGHTRLKAAIERGDEFVPVITYPDLHGHKSNAYRIASNKTGEIADWDEALLSELLIEILESNESIDLDAIGFDDKELKQLLGEIAEPTPIAEKPIPELPNKPKTKLGDLWTLGGHRVLCGDATSKNDVTTLLCKELPMLMVTDPPYGVNYDPDWRKPYGNDVGRSKGRVANDTQSDWASAYKLFPGNVMYLWQSAFMGDIFDQIDFELRAQIIWAKQCMVFGRGHYHWQHEVCWYAIRKGNTAAWAGDRKQTTIWNVPNADVFHGGKVDDMKTEHSTQKPVELMSRSICNHKGDVFDPFLGSGTTLIAAEQLGRRCFGMEIEPAYCDVIVKRWENLTGQKAQKEKA